MCCILLASNKIGLKMSADNNNPRLAVLIDADNTFKFIDIIDELFEEISKFGDASVRRIYGDWTSENLKNWKPVLPKHAIQPIQQYANTKGKNATDSALIIDAMDLLYTAPLDGFCIVSSDSDFTRLAIRFREAGKLVYGFGEEKTPDSLIAACTQFKYYEILSKNNLSSTAIIATSPSDNLAEKKQSNTNTKGVNTPTAGSDKKPELGIQNTSKELAIEALSDEDGFAHMGEVKKHIVKNFPAFDSRNYKHDKFSSLIQAIGLFELDAQKQHIKDKRKK
jgi:predicted nuclease of predicted toxin-antitoxin system